MRASDYNGPARYDRRQELRSSLGLESKSRRWRDGTPALKGVQC